MSLKPPRTPLTPRSAFISGGHLRSPGCREGFPRRVRCEQPGPVGDIFDLRSLERTFFWPRQRKDVIGPLPAFALGQAA